MIPQRKATRAVRSAGALVFAALTLLGCTPEAAPTPTPTAAFASEEEAFAAAEEVYRAYNDELNRQRSGDTQSDPTRYLVGKILSSETSTAQQLKDQGIHIEGTTTILSFSGRLVDADSAVASIQADVCLDISLARAINEDGADVTPSDRASVVGVEVTITGTPGMLLISEYKMSTVIQC